MEHHRPPVSPARSNPLQPVRPVLPPLWLEESPDEPPRSQSPSAPSFYFYFKKKHNFRSISFTTCCEATVRPESPDTNIPRIATRSHTRTSGHCCRWPIVAGQWSLCRWPPPPLPSRDGGSYLSAPPSAQQGLVDPRLFSSLCRSAARHQHTTNNSQALDHLLGLERLQATK